jgi:hypothetical protein
MYHALGSEAVGYWSFDEGLGSTVGDSSSNNNIGEWNLGGALWSTDDAILGNAAGRFTGSNYVSVPDNPLLNPTEQITVEAWIKQESLLGTYDHVVSKRSADTGYYITFSGTPTKLVFVVKTNFGSRTAFSNDPIPLGVWTHFVGTYDKQRVRLYIDGILQTSGTNITEPINISTNPLNIGRYSNSGNYYKGLIDEVRIYSKALSSAEIQQHYAEGLGRHQDLAVK